MAASIIFNQVGAPAGVAGKSRDDFVVGAVVTCSTPSGAATYQWTLVDVPIRSDLRGLTGTGPTFTFTPDVKGTYLVALKLNSSDQAENNTRGFCAVLSDLGWRYKAAHEQGEDNLAYLGLGFVGNTNDRGWATSEDLIREDIESAVGEVQAATVTSPGPGPSPLVKLDPLTGKLAASVVPPLEETSGPDALTLGAIPDNTFVARSGSNLVGQTATQVTAALDDFVGDSGLGGTKGLVPAPAAGDAASGKYLKADGTWTQVPSTSLVLDPSVVASSGNVYKTFAEVVTAANAGNTPTSVYVVGNVSVLVGSFDLSKISFFAPPQTYTITLGGTVTLTDLPREIDHLSIENAKTTGSLCTCTTNTQTRCRSGVLYTSGTSSFIDLNNRTISVYLDTGSSVSGNGASYPFFTGTGTVDLVSDAPLTNFGSDVANSFPVAVNLYLSVLGQTSTFSSSFTGANVTYQSGPGNSTSNAVATWNGTSGNVLQDTDLTYVSNGLSYPVREGVLTLSSSSYFTISGRNETGGLNSLGVMIKGGNASGGSATGGEVSVYGGDGSDQGGPVNIIGGSGASTTGGNVLITGGMSASGTGGPLLLNGGATLSGSGGDVRVTAGMAAGTNQMGGSVYINTTNGTSSTNLSTGSGWGSRVYIFGGKGGDTGLGGDVRLQAGDGGTFSGFGGDVYVKGGTGTGSDGGGWATLQGGAAGATGLGGDARVIGGVGGITSGNGGPVSVVGGAAQGGGSGGAVNITGGASFSSGTGGSINIGAGVSTGTNNGANIVLTPTAFSTTGRDGYVQIAPNASRASRLSFAQGAAPGTTEPVSSVSFAAPSGVTSYTMLLPASPGSSSQVLSVTSVSGTQLSLGWTSGGGISGSGTTNTIPVWTGTSALGNSSSSTGNVTLSSGQGFTITVQPSQAAASSTGSTVTVQGGAGGSTSGGGGAVTVRGGAATTSGAGGALNLAGGTAVGSSQTGGVVYVNTTNGTSSTTLSTGTSTGPAVAIFGGGGGTGGGDGGAVTVQGGAGNGNATGGTVTIQGGASSGPTGGLVWIKGGTSSTGAGGNITLSGGAGGASVLGSNGGSINITGGSPSVSNGSGGSVTISAGIPISTTNTAGSNVALVGGDGGKNGGVNIVQAGGSVTFQPGRGSSSTTDGYVRILRTSTDNRASRLQFVADDATTVDIKAPTAITSSYSLVWPTAQGSSNSVLQNDGSGNLQFVTTAWLLKCKYATTGNITLSGAQTIDGQSPTTGDRILVWRQTSRSANGIYIYNSAGAWTRATDFNSSVHIVDGISVRVTNGDTLRGSFHLAATGAATLGTDALFWLKNESYENVVAGTTYTILAEDLGSTIKFTSGSAITVTANTLATMGIGKAGQGSAVALINFGGGQVTVSAGDATRRYDTSTYTGGVKTKTAQYSPPITLQWLGTSDLHCSGGLATS